MWTPCVIHPEEQRYSIILFLRCVRAAVIISFALITKAITVTFKVVMYYLCLLFKLTWVNAVLKIESGRKNLFLWMSFFFFGPSVSTPFFKDFRLHDIFIDYIFYMFKKVPQFNTKGVEIANSEGWAMVAVICLSRRELQGWVVLE